MWSYIMITIYVKAELYCNDNCAFTQTLTLFLMIVTESVSYLTLSNMLADLSQLPCLLTL